MANNCKVCKERPTNPMIGSIEPIIKDGKIIKGNDSYCSRVCQDLDNNLDNQFISRDMLQRIAIRLHTKSLK